MIIRIGQGLTGWWWISVRDKAGGSPRGYINKEGIEKCFPDKFKAERQAIQVVKRYHKVKFLGKDKIASRIYETC